MGWTAGPAYACAATCDLALPPMPCYAGPVSSCTNRIRRAEARCSAHRTRRCASRADEVELVRRRDDELVSAVRQRQSEGLRKLPAPNQPAILRTVNGSSGTVAWSSTEAKSSHSSAPSRGSRRRSGSVFHRRCPRSTGPSAARASCHRSGRLRLPRVRPRSHLRRGALPECLLMWQLCHVSRLESVTPTPRPPTAGWRPGAGRPSLAKPLP